jgi:hypothetical protein
MQVPSSSSDNVDEVQMIALERTPDLAPLAASATEKEAVFLPEIAIEAHDPLPNTELLRDPTPDLVPTVLESADKENVPTTVLPIADVYPQPTDAVTSVRSDDSDSAPAVPKSADQDNVPMADVLLSDSLNESASALVIEHMWPQAEENALTDAAVPMDLDAVGSSAAEVAEILLPQGVSLVFGYITYMCILNSPWQKNCR